ncbi:MAG: NAD-dependent DNA ligase LigA [Myxococcota bacterium]
MPSSVQAPSPRAAELEKQVRHHNHLYWDLNAPEISDLEFDALVRELQRVWPEAPVLQELGPQEHPQPALPVGASEVERLGTEVLHVVPMLSLDKAYTDAELKKWSDKIQGNLVIMAKVDGVACSIHYNEHGELRMAATRGDGWRGDDVTANVRASRFVPERVTLKNVEVRGEMYMKRSRFRSAYAQQFANPRNLTAGAIKQKDPKKAAAYGLSFFAYDLLGTNLALEGDKLKRLSELGFDVIPHETVEAEEAPGAYLRMAAQRAGWDFESDGVVFRANRVSEQTRVGVTAHHPKYALAYKFQGESATAALSDVTWSVSRNGTLTPVAVIEPTAISGVTVTRASLHHAGYIGKLGIRKGSKLLVMRRGDVIPHVEGVVEPGHDPYEIPATCPSCGSPTVLRGDFLFCTQPAHCTDAIVGTLKHFTQTLDIQGLGPKVLRTLVDNKLVTTPADFYRLKKDQLLPLERMGETLAAKLVANIDAKRRLTVEEFLTALGIDELGPSVAENLVHHFHTLQRIQGATVEELSSVHGVGEAIARSVSEGLKAKATLVEELLKEVTLVEERPAAKTDHPLSGKTFVFTGTLKQMERKEAQKRVQALGAKTPSGVTKELDYLVVGTEKDGGESSKLKSARKLISQGAALKVLTEEEFLALLEGRA